MKKTIKLAVVAALALGTTSAFATNGDQMIGLGAESRALGGTGIANYMGSANALTNPSLLAKTKVNNEFTFAGTMFKADVKASTTAGNVDGSGDGISKTSDEGMSMIPAISLLHRINETTVFGLGMYGTAGMGTDWRGSTGLDNTAGKVDLYNMRSSLMLMQFAPSIAYGTDTFGIGLTAIMQYGALSIDYDTTDANHVGSGISNDFGYGFQLGGYYNPTKSITLGAVYKSAIDMEYKNQISDAAAAFGYTGAGLAAKSDHLEQPAEYGVGVAFDMGDMTYTADIKEIKWGSAKGYKDFGWKDQTVYALGAKYKSDSYWLGAGFNYAKSPIPNATSNINPTSGVAAGALENTDGDTMNMFNYVMFPATTESHYTIGGGYTITEGMALDLAFTYAPEVSDTVSVATVGAGNLTTKHSQKALTVALKFNY